MLRDLHFCQRCPLRAYADRKPDGLLARLWRWHTRWCPGWRRYQRWLAAEEDRQAIPDTDRDGAQDLAAQATAADTDPDATAGPP